ncbi:MAG: stage II sporulation protein M [Bacillota bacterium]
MKQDYKGILAYFRKNPGIFIFVVLVILAGAVCGVLLVRFLDEGPLTEVTSALHSFFNDLKEEERDLLAAPELLRASYYKNGVMLLLIWILGLYSAGFTLVLPILFLKGLSLGFTAGVVIYRYSFKGALFCLAALLPHNLFFVPAYILAAVFAFAYSFYLFKNRCQRVSIFEHPFIRQYCLYMAAVLVAAVMGGLVEAYITPVFIRLVLPVL